MLQVATTVHKEGDCTLSEAFRIVSPNVQYTAQPARSKLLQMPLASLHVDFKSGVSKCFLVEHHPSVNYQNLIALLKTVMERQQPKSGLRLEKAIVKSLLGLYQSDRERECVRYAVYKAHEEVQYWWALEHLQMGRLATLVTARSSGSSFLNRVELQNSCLTRGHSNLFIPSTLAGSCIETGRVNEETLKQNLELAIEIYIKRVDQSPCGESDIHLFKGASAPEYHKIRDHLKVFLKG